MALTPSREAIHEMRLSLARAIVKERFLELAAATTELDRISSARSFITWWQFTRGKNLDLIDFGITYDYNWSCLPRS